MIGQADADNIDKLVGQQFLGRGILPREGKLLGELIAAGGDQVGDSVEFKTAGSFIPPRMGHARPASTNNSNFQVPSHEQTPFLPESFRFAGSILQSKPPGHKDRKPCIAKGAKPVINFAMKLRKAFKWSLVLIPVALLITGMILLLMLDRLARKTIESQATASTQLKTTLAAANVSLLKGQIQLQQLQVGSPRGFASATMFDLASVRVEVEYARLLQKPIRIAKLVIDGPHLTLEQNQGKLNVTAAMEQMPATTEGSDTAGMKLIIEELQVNNTSVTLRTGMPGAAGEMNFTIPSLTLHQIGTAGNGNQGAAIRDVLWQVLAALSQKATNSIHFRNIGGLVARPNVKPEHLETGIKGLLGGREN